MQVRSDDVFWPTHHPHHFSKINPLTEDLHCETVVVGAGITGALVAHHLSTQGMKVVVVDRSQPGSGSTAVCTALVQYELDEPLTSIAKIHNLDHAVRAYQTCVKSLDWLADHVSSLDESCELAERPTIMLARHVRDLVKMRKEVAARQSAGIDVKMLERDGLKEQFQIDRPGAIYSPRSFELDPYALTRATLEKSVEMGARVYAPVDVLSINCDVEGVTISSAHGPQIRARHGILATGYETRQFIGNSVGKLHSTWAAVSEPIDVEKYWRNRQLIWEWGDAYLYARLTSDNRVIFGGGDRGFTNPHLRDLLIDRKSQAIKKQIEKLFPELQLTIAHAWAGEFATTPDGMPYIGACKSCPNLYLALGYGGNGITFSLIAARILTGILCDIPSFRQPVDLFRFDR